ncbi:hypothetical protein RFI_12910 [Reticulomyxa filosa]|uniref:Fibronectin type-III domain-containing protein n=1 Tax=Reticulomyxa filosa TaxID=46433 RepID=X6NEQ8_RETFI|nr:hypothetical protein RFI_12910 [Reticulomyxa filosa]|eukprot:ETO24249.1 hypothetical protein RFI_12910 [Reticulomyxa filosa]
MCICICFHVLLRKTNCGTVEYTPVGLRSVKLTERELMVVWQMEDFAMKQIVKKQQKYPSIPSSKLWHFELRIKTLDNVFKEKGDAESKESDKVIIPCNQRYYVCNALKPNTEYELSLQTVFLWPYLNDHTQYHRTESPLTVPVGFRTFSNSEEALNVPQLQNAHLRQVTSQSAELEWEETAGQGTAYEIYEHNQGEGKMLDTVIDNIRWQTKGLRPSTEYIFTIKAVNGKTTVESNPVQFWTPSEGLFLKICFFFFLLLKTTANNNNNNDIKKLI